MTVRSLGVSLGLMVLLGAGCTPPQTASPSGANAFTGGTYRITLDDKVRVNINGATRDVRRDDIKAGSRVGDITLTAEQVAQLNAAIPGNLTLTVNPKGLGDLHEITVTADSAQAKQGLYNARERSLLFGEITNAQKSADGKCGAIEGSSVKGYLTADYSRIERGEINTGFLAGCNPVLVTGSVTFYYTAARVN